MSTIERPDCRVLPPLEAGQRLDQRTFHERYEAMPPSTRAELIGGKLAVSSDVDAGTEVELTIPAGRAYTSPNERRRTWLAEKFLAKLSGRGREKNT